MNRRVFRRLDRVNNVVVLVPRLFTPAAAISPSFPFSLGFLSRFVSLARSRKDDGRLGLFTSGGSGHRAPLSKEPVMRPVYPVLRRTTRPLIPFFHLTASRCRCTVHIQSCSALLLPLAHSPARRRLCTQPSASAWAVKPNADVLGSHVLKF